MNLSKPSRLAAIISLIIVNARSCGAESSGEYLQKVMIELQELNVPSNSLTMYDRLSSMNLGYQQAGYHNYGQDNRYRKVSTNSVHQDVQKPIAGVPVEQDMAHSNNIVQYYAVCILEMNLINGKVKGTNWKKFSHGDLSCRTLKNCDNFFGSFLSLSTLVLILQIEVSISNCNLRLRVTINF